MPESQTTVDPFRRNEVARVLSGRQLVSTEADAPPSILPFFRFADTGGDGAGTKNANGDYSGAEEEFFIQPSGDGVMVVNRMILTIRDMGSFMTSGYGGGPALGTGIAVQIRTGPSTVILDLTDGITIKTNGDWSRYSYDVQLLSLGGGDSYLSCRWTFERSGKAIRLVSGQRLAFILNDDMTGLNEQFFHFQGYEVA
jgi:hypothetical protein